MCISPANFFPILIMQTKFNSFPKISIVTPSYNQGHFLEDTILSILNQTYPNVEYIIIDGGSTDNSVQIIKKYEKRLAYWISEQDQGQTHAINKGLKVATGEVVNWINSDDLLEPDSLLTLDKAIEKRPDADIYFGDFSAIDRAGNRLFVRKSGSYHFNTLFWGRQLSCQPSVFFKRNLLKKIGYLDRTYNFCMDIEFWIRAAVHGAKFQQIKSPIGVNRVHGEAKTTKLQDVLYREHKELVRKYGFLKPFSKDSKAEDYYFTAMNRLWRLVAALYRFSCRRDVSFLKVSKALAALNHE